MKNLKEIDEEWRSVLKELKEARTEYETLTSQAVVLERNSALSLSRLKPDERKKKEAEAQSARDSVAKTIDSVKTKIAKIEESLASNREEFYEAVQKERRPQKNPFEIMDEYRKETEQFITPYVKNLSFLEVTVIPEGIKLVDIGKVRDALKASSEDFRGGWPYIFFLEGTKVSPVSKNNMVHAVSNEPFFGTPEFDYWAFYYESSIFYSRDLSVYSRLGEPDKFSYFDEAKIIGEIVLSIGKLYKALGVSIDSEVTIAFRYSPTKNLVAVDGSIFKRQYSKPFSDSELTHKTARSIDDCLNKAPQVASEIIYNLLGKLGYWGGYGHDAFVPDIEKHLKTPKN